MRLKTQSLAARPPRGPSAAADLPAPAARKWFAAASANPAFKAAEASAAGGPAAFARFAASCGLAGAGGAASFPPPSDPSAERFCITTAINYANGLPHMGHAYEAVSSDCIARYHRLYGRKVLFMTGADEHGQKIADTAAARGIKPIELCDQYVSAFQELNKRLKVTNDVYNRTTSAKHKETCARLLELSMKAGDVYLDSYEGWYNVREETFVTEKDAAATDYKDPVSGKPLEKMKEESFFFKQSRYQARLIEHIKANPDFVRPEACRKEILARLEKEPLLDLSISRTTFDWGIPLPNNPKHVMCVRGGRAREEVVPRGCCVG